MDIKNVGLGTMIGNKLNIYSISKPKDIENIDLGLEDGIVDAIDNKYNDVSNYPKFNEQALVDENQFYLDLNSLEEDNQFFYIQEALCHENLISDAEQIGLKKEHFEELDSKKEKIKFLILENESQYLFLWLNPYNQIIKHKSGINIGVGALPTKFDIIYGIVFPNKISAILDKETKKLSIIDVLAFERMFNLKSVRLAKAVCIFQKFKSQEYTIGKDEIKIRFSDSVDLYSSKYGKTRQITYLSNYNPQKAKYETTKIEEAISHLPSDEQIKIEKGTILIENESQFKTFVAILHDSILHRMLSDSYESL